MHLAPLINVLIVLNYNDADTVIRYISVVSSYNELTHIVIVDNQSTDGSYARLTAEYKGQRKIRVILAPFNHGYASGNNFGIKFAEDTFGAINNIIISNPDILITEADLHAILQPLSRGYALSTGLIYSDYGYGLRLVSNFAWKIPSYWDLAKNEFMGIYKINRVLLHRGIYYQQKEMIGKEYFDVEAVPGCFFAISDNAIRRVDYLDESTFLFGEETILGFKLREHGQKCCLVCNAKIIHQNSVSINKVFNKDRWIANELLKSHLVYLKTYLDTSRFGCGFFCGLFWLSFIEKHFWGAVLVPVNCYRRLERTLNCQK